MEEKQSKIPRKHRKILLIGGIVAGLFLAAVAVTGIFIKNASARKEFVLYIYPGENYEQVKSKLLQAGVLDSSDEKVFDLLANLLKYPRLVKPGKYKIEEGTPFLSLLRKLRSGLQAPVKTVIPSKREISQIFEHVARYFYFSEEDLQAELSEGFLYDSTEFNEYSVLGMFIPNTYEFYWTTTPEKFLQRMLSEYRKFWSKKERSKKAERLGLSPLEIIVIASIVQEETSKKEEYSKIAGVYINRIKKGMKLQADPTIRYALRNFNIRRVLLEHLKFDSPYNTYLYEGLPPGPINNPYPRVIDAVLNYEKHNYLFFCASPKLDGSHLFARTYAEHQKNAKKYQHVLNKRQIYQ